MAAPHDDAPITASKRTEKTAQAAENITEPKGSSLVGQSVTINRPRHELYAKWRDFSGFPNFMENIERVEMIDDVTSHWAVKGPGGSTIEWDAVVTEDQPDRLIAWSSAEGADVPNSGRVEFRDAGERGTIVSATILYDPPAGIIGKLIAKMFQREPALQARRDLRRFKQLMETGEIATSARTARALEEEAA
ncbi:cyclase [Altererythrobacter xixiisoli]|uniref:Cyclase n=1 Tax=Croceibacterium xixiisoli TaxID=1476466 RepID=A0A6I4U1W0_9SPHN|nr:SRPBCC family protein [Croceibacterium xixiisoli]MXP00839.1 cyclase [Croceibacterium xixiisoli]